MDKFLSRMLAELEKHQNNLDIVSGYYPRFEYSDVVLSLQEKVTLLKYLIKEYDNHLKEKFAENLHKMLNERAE